MAVAVVWQAVFTIGFCGRWATSAEAIALGGSVWLIYVADRLLDARRLDLTVPHSRRHRFHHDHCVPLTIAWAMVLVAVAAVALSGLDAATIRCGIVVAAAALLYGAGVHFSPAIELPKEMLVGVIFAGGVSLIIWVSDPSWSAASATVSASILFVVNCHIVSSAEQSIDRHQPFGSASTGAAAGRSWWPMMAVIAVQVFAGGPLLVRVSLVSAAALLMLAGRFRVADVTAATTVAAIPQPARVVFADVTLVVVPVAALMSPIG